MSCKVAVLFRSEAAPKYVVSQVLSLAALSVEQRPLNSHTDAWTYNLMASK